MSFVIAAVAAATLVPLIARIGSRLGLVDHPGELKIHARPVPLTGGPAVVLAVLLGMGLTGHGEPWIAAATCLALGGGMVDDARELPPWVRLVVQAAAGALLVAGGLRLEPLGALGGPALVLATVACCNAVNMIDGQDGLAGGLGVAAALGLAGVLATFGRSAVLHLAVAGALVGFVIWNRPPARVFLGDGGAYAVGVLLAASASLVSADGWHGLLAAGACLGVFAYELVSSIVRRLVSASPAIRGDRDHSYDRLASRLGSRARSTLVMFALGAIASLVGVAVDRVGSVAALALVATVALVTALLDVRLLPVSAVKGDA
ncbi:MAG: glycosyltransferase family 4 protein [Actinomycetota bacterium]